MSKAILRRAWPLAAVLAALALSGGTGGTCGGGGTEDPQAGACVAPADCLGLPHVACLGDWTCQQGACRWVCDKPDGTGCRTEADCEGLPHDDCMGRWACRDDGTCAWGCDTEPVECVADSDCGMAGAAPADVACDGAWKCQGGRCQWTCIGPPWECTSDTQCPDGQACVNGACQPGTTGCVVSGCSGEICAAQPMASDCLWLDWYQCLPLTTCGLRADGTCGWDLNEAFLQCRDGGTAPCATDADCRNDPRTCPDATACEMRCIDGVCQTPACVPVPEACNGVDDDCDGEVDEGCPVPHECYTDADCAPGQACDHTGYADRPGCCVPLPDGTGCPADYPQCPGVCVGVPVPCTADDECGPGQACVAGTCVSGPPACTAVKPGSHGACKMLLGWIFDGTGCVAEGGCSCEPDCGAFFDSEAACRKACGSPPLPCASDADCTKGEACRNGLCVPACVPAKEACNGLDDDCDGQVDEDCPGAPCELDEACPAGQYCGDYLCGNGWCSGTCLDLPDGLCGKDLDCGQGQVCTKDACPPCIGCPCLGTCTALPACVAVKPGSHGTCEMILGVIFDGKQCVYESGCGCGADCDLFFRDFPSCWKACNAWPPD